MSAAMTIGYSKYLHALYPAANLREAYIDGYEHPGDWPEGWEYRTFSAEGDAFRAGQKQRAEDGSNE